MLQLLEVKQLEDGFNIFTIAKSWIVAIILYIVAEYSVIV